MQQRSAVNPKTHHYVPQFYLKRFTGPTGKLWAWDRDNDRVFQTSPTNVAAKQNFYRVTKYEDQGSDGFEMERQFSVLESDISPITGRWLELVRATNALARIPISPAERSAFAQYLALQYLRTEDTRNVLTMFHDQIEGATPLDDLGKRELHTDILWTEAVYKKLANRLATSTWIFAVNRSKKLFITSDNPVAFRTADNRRWLKAGIINSDTYVVFPLAPDVILYCYPQIEKFEPLNKWQDCVSPVSFNNEMVDSDNSGQVFMASRFIFSVKNDFDAERQFAPTIGTNLYDRQTL